MPRFVVLYHETPPHAFRPSHWDLMFEIGPALRTWALQEEPAIGQAAPAVPLADHRLAYLDYEGEISGGRGSVRRVDRGEFRLLRQTDDELVAELWGQRLKCRCTARKTNDGWIVQFAEGSRHAEQEEGSSPGM